MKDQDMNLEIKKVDKQRDQDRELGKDLRIKCKTKDDKDGMMMMTTMMRMKMMKKTKVE
jgi:hypothetical protein